MAKSLSTDPSLAIPADGVGRRCWPFFNTPLSIYLSVMLPICLLEIFLIFSRATAWMQLSAGVVVAISIYGLFRGYVRRLILSADGVTLHGVFQRITIPWKSVVRMGVYAPGGGVGATECFFVTTRSEPPRGRWDIDSATIQVQNRPGLPEAAEHFCGVSTVAGYSKTPVEAS